jgi:hypothetical protein
MGPRQGPRGTSRRLKVSQTTRPDPTLFPPARDRAGSLHARACPFEKRHGLRGPPPNPGVCEQTRPRCGLPRRRRREAVGAPPVPLPPGQPPGDAPPQSEPGVADGLQQGRTDLRGRNCGDRSFQSPRDRTDCARPTTRDATAPGGRASHGTTGCARRSSGAWPVPGEPAPPGGHCPNADSWQPDGKRFTETRKVVRHNQIVIAKVLLVI